MALHTPTILYLLFSGQTYSEFGGDGDCKGVYDDLDEALEDYDAEVAEMSKSNNSLNWIRLCRPVDDSLVVVKEWPLKPALSNPANTPGSRITVTITG